MSKQRIQVIFNPVSAGGKTQTHFKEIMDELGNYFGNGFAVYITTRQNEAENIARTVIENGTDLIIGVGGDGTLNEIINGFYSNGRLINHECRLGIISSGTGEGFSRSLMLPKNLSEQVEIIQKGKTKSVDIGRIIYSSTNGSREERYFLNEFQVGIGGAVVKNVDSSLKKLGGSISFALGTVKTALIHPNQFLSIKTNSKNEYHGQFVGLVVANGNTTGGGMLLTPDAKIDDAQFDLLLMHDQTPLERLWNFPKIYSGSHIRSEKFEIIHADHIEIDSDENIPIEADGELLGNLPCSVELLHAQIHVCYNNNGDQNEL